MPASTQTPSFAPSTVASTAAAPTAAPPTVESASAEASFLLLEPRYAAIPRDRIATVNVDIQAAAVFALGVSQIITEATVRARFKDLTRCGEYDDACVDALEPAARAAWYTRHRLLLTNATRSGAQLPLTVIDEATTLRARMLKLAEYWLSDAPAEAAEIVAIRAGSGYQDLANDLLGLAAMLERNDAELAQDRKLYRLGDPAEARRQADRMLGLLGVSVTQEQSRWSALQARAWTHLLDVYEEVRRGGRFLFAGDRPDQRFPSLVAVARAASSGRSAPIEEDSNEEEEEDSGASVTATPAAPAALPS